MGRTADLCGKGALQAVLIHSCNNVEVLQAGLYVLVHILQGGTSLHIGKLAIVAGSSPPVNPVACYLQLCSNAPGELILLIPGNHSKAEHLCRRRVVHLNRSFSRCLRTVHIRQAQPQLVGAGFKIGQLPSDLQLGKALVLPLADDRAAALFIHTIQGIFLCPYCMLQQTGHKG